MFLAGDDVPAKKPDPTIYRIAAERLGVSPEQCIVIEDSVIGAQVAFAPHHTRSITCTVRPVLKISRGQPATMTCCFWRRVLSLRLYLGASAG